MFSQNGTEHEATMIQILTRRHPYQLFIIELNEVLKLSGITPYRRPVTAGADREKNWIDPSTQQISQPVGKVIIYMEEHLSDNLSLEELAGEAKLSKFQLIRKFQEEQGTTPWKFLIGKRINRAKELLEKGLSPGQTAAETGFYDQSHMNKVFREATGFTPKEYQEKNFRNKN